MVFKDFEVRFVLAEASLQHYILVDLTSSFLTASNLHVDLEVKTFDLSINKTNFIIMGIFSILLALNVYIFLNREYNVWIRYSGWYEINISPLTEYEKE